MPDEVKECQNIKWFALRWNKKMLSLVVSYLNFFFHSQIAVLVYNFTKCDKYNMYLIYLTIFLIKTQQFYLLVGIALNI